MHVALLQAPPHRLIAAVDQRRGREDDPMIRHFSFFSVLNNTGTVIPVLSK